MKATVKTFQSGCGDCIFLILKDEANGETYHVLIDCGKFTSEIKDFMAQLHKSVAYFCSIGLYFLV